jgi:hypothetical protein
MIVALQALLPVLQWHAREWRIDTPAGVGFAPK